MRRGQGDREPGAACPLHAGGAGVCMEPAPQYNTVLDETVMAFCWRRCSEQPTHNNNQPIVLLINSEAPDNDVDNRGESWNRSGLRLRRLTGANGVPDPEHLPGGRVVARLVGARACFPGQAS